MSLVLDALRRVERSTGGPGRAGDPVAFGGTVFFRRYARLWPLLSGMLVGVVLVAGNGDGAGSRQTGDVPRAASVSSSHARGGAGLPPPPFGAARLSARARLTPPPPAQPRARRLPPVASPTPLPFILQAISERDSRLMAVVNDQLVAEGDSLGTATVIRIDADSVVMGWLDGRRETVRFPPTPVPDPTASPLPH